VAGELVHPPPPGLHYLQFASMETTPLYPGTSMETRPRPLLPRSCFPGLSGVAAVSSAQVSLPLCLGVLTLSVRGQTQEPSAWPIPQCIVANYPARQRVPCPLCGRPPPRASGLAPPHDLLPPPGRSAPESSSWVATRSAPSQARCTATWHRCRSSPCPSPFLLRMRGIVMGRRGHGCSAATLPQLPSPRPDGQMAGTTPFCA
jgi:hypothetical protein